MKKINKYSGKKLRRPEIGKPFVKITDSLITCQDLSDAEFRLLCFLFSYSNGTTITTNNLSKKLNKSERRVLEVLSHLVDLGILNFTETNIEVFQSNNESNCEIPQCEKSHLDSNECDISHDEVRDSAPCTAENFISNCDNSQSNIVEDTDNKDVTASYNNSIDKKILDKKIIHNNSVTAKENFSLINSSNKETGNDTSPFNSSKDTLPIGEDDFKPKEELEKIISKDGKIIWRLKNKLNSQFIQEKYVSKFIDLYNQWLNMDIKVHSKFGFIVFEIIAVYMLVTVNRKRISNNAELNDFVSLYPIPEIPKYLSGYLDEALEDFNKYMEVVKPFRKQSVSTAV